MNKVGHRVYISILVLIVISTVVWIISNGFSYYNTSLEERFFHPSHESLKPSGLWGHGMGIIGSLMIIIGVFGYMARKHYRSLSRIGLLKHWLEFHIFLCTLGSILILFHTTFKFGGIVSISFWSMVAVVLSGVIGRFIYIQIPRTIEGKALNLNEVKSLKSNMEDLLNSYFHLNEKQRNKVMDALQLSEVQIRKFSITAYIKRGIEDFKKVVKLRYYLTKTKIDKTQIRSLIKLVRREIKLNRKIERLQTMQNLFKYWHVAHLPFALVMLIIMIIHVAVTLVFGYRWIF